MKKEDSYEIELINGKELNFDDIEDREPFVPDGMIKLAQNMYQEIEKKREDEIVNQVYKFAVNVDKEKVREWLKRDAMLDHIEETELVDIAVKKRFRKLEQELKFKNNQIGDLEEENRVLKKALELACGDIENGMCGIDIDRMREYRLLEAYYIQQAKESEKDECVDN